MAFGFGMGFPRNEPFAGGPSLNLQFAGNTVLDPAITFTRALNTATYFNSAGVLTTANANVARFDYDPATLAPRGLLIEEARTNSIRNNTMQGAVAGTPGTAPTNWNIDLSAVSGISREIVGTGTESGITYIDIRLSGTSAVTANALILLDGNNAAAASSSQAWAVSSYVKLQAGSLTGIASTFLEIYEYSSVPAYLRQTSAVTFTLTTAGLSTQRVSGTVTTGASTAFTRGSVSVRFTSGIAADITLRIGLPQLEQGAFATSVIPTTTTALTRNADVAVMTGANFSSWYNQATGSFFCEHSRYQNTDFGMLLETKATSTNTSDRIAILVSSTAEPRFQNFIGGSTVLDSFATYGPLAANTVVKSALAYLSGSNAATRDGASPTTSATTFATPTYTNLQIGGTDNNVYGPSAQSFLNGWLRRITYYPRRLSNAELVSITS